MIPYLLLLLILLAGVTLIVRVNMHLTLCENTIDECYGVCVANIDLSRDHGMDALNEASGLNDQAWGYLKAAHKMHPNPFTKPPVLDFDPYRWKA